MFVNGLNESIKTLFTSYHVKYRNLTFLDALYFSRADSNEARAIIKTHLTGRKIHAERLAVANRALVRHPSALVLESIDDSHETDYLSLQGDLN